MDLEPDSFHAWTALEIGSRGEPWKVKGLPIPFEACAGERHEQLMIIL